MKGQVLIMLYLVAVCFARKQAKSCQRNEILDECSNALCRNQRCDTIGQIMPCRMVMRCIPGCVCKKGYLRNKNGTCVPTRQCEPIACRDGEIFTKTKSACAKDTCQSLDPSYQCNENLPSKPGCVCPEEYVRRDASSPCDIFICDCPEMENDPWCDDAYSYEYRK